MRAARIGPTVWLLEGPTPIEKRSNAEMTACWSLLRWSSFGERGVSALSSSEPSFTVALERKR